MWFANRRQTERRLDRLEDALADVQRELGVLKGEAFALEELRRQARNAVRSLERAAANAQDAPEPTNGRGRRVEPAPKLDLPPLPPPGPRRNY